MIRLSRLSPMIIPFIRRIPRELRKLAGAATVVIGISAIVNTCVAYQQWNVAEKSANAALQSAEVARAALEATHRPWIDFKGLKTPVIGPNKKQRVTFVVANSGRSPVLNGRVLRGSWLTRDGLELPMPPPYTQPPVPSQLVMGTGKTEELDINLREITEQEFDAITKGERRLYVYLRIDYSDQFKKDRFSTFCYFYKPGEAPGEAWRIYEHYNEAF